MAREAKPYWHKGANCWVSVTGARGKNGRRTPVYFRKDEHGREIPNTKTGERAARKMLDAHLRRRDEDEACSTGSLTDPTVEQLRLLWLSHVKRVGTPETYKVARSTVGRFTGFAHAGGFYRDRRAAALTTTDLTRFIEAMREKGRKPHYLAKLFGVVQAMLNWAADPQPNRVPERLLPEGNPLRRMKGPAVPDSPERFADRGEMAAFLRGWVRAARSRKRGGKHERDDRNCGLLIRCLIQTGARPGEFCKAEWADVTWEVARTAEGHPFGKIVLPPERWKAGKKTGKARTVYLTPVLTRALRRESEQPDRHPVYLFSHFRRKRGGSPDGDPWTPGALASKVRKLRRKEGLEDAGANRMVAYLFRHTYLSRGLMRGIDPVTLSTLCGTSPKMLQKHYGHLLQSHVIGAAQTMMGAQRDKVSRE